MKKIAAALASGALALSLVLAGCSSQGAPSSTKATEEATQEDAQTKQAPTTEGTGEQLIVGGWTVQTEAKNSLSKKQLALFGKAMQSLVGVSYEPICELATQVVAGTNHAYLAKGYVASEEPKEGWFIVTVYEDPEGNPTVGMISEVDIAHLQTASGPMADGLMGAWSVVEPGKTELLPKEAADAFAKASKDYKDAELQPLATVATQVVSGTNYLVLCNGQGASDSARSIYAVVVYADLKGNAEFTSVDYLNLLPYVSAA
jgi:hypothetical protein